MNEKKVPSVVIKRLPRYYRYLGDLIGQGITRISSHKLSRKMGVTASQIRHDFNYFGGFGQQGYGYNVEYLYGVIGGLLGLNDGNTTIIVGAGNLGRALANHGTFEKRGFKLIGIFDNDEQIIGTSINGIEVMDISGIEEFMRKNKTDIGILTVPKNAVHETAMRLAECGIRGILNFSYTEIELPYNIAVENVHLSDYLMTLAYRMKDREEKDQA